jgi:hypothetical protein
MAYDQDKFGIIINPDDTIQILCTADDVLIADEFVKLGITDGHIVLRADMPDEISLFFSALRMNTATNTVYTDLVVAKQITIRENENKVDRETAAMRADFEKAYDADDASALQCVKNARKQLRDALTIKINAINACTNIQQIQAHLP